MLSRSQIQTRLSKLPHFHLISYLFQAEAGYHVVVLRCKAVKYVFPIHTNTDVVVKVNDSGNELLATLHNAPFTSFKLEEHAKEIQTL